MVKKQKAESSIFYFFTQFLVQEKFQNKGNDDCVVINVCKIIQNAQKVPKAQGTSLQRLLYVQKVKGKLM